MKAHLHVGNIIAWKTYTLFPFTSSIPREVLAEGRLTARPWQSGASRWARDAPATPTPPARWKKGPPKWRHRRCRAPGREPELGAGGRVCEEALGEFNTILSIIKTASYSKTRNTIITRNTILVLCDKFIEKNGINCCKFQYYSQICSWKYLFFSYFEKRGVINYVIYDSIHTYT